MGKTRHDGAKSAVLALGLAWAGVSGMAYAQMTGGPGLSSGTGQGTGAGGFSGVIRNPSGSISGTGPAPTGGVRSDSGGAPWIGPGRGTVPFGPGVDVTFPDDPYLVPFLLPEQAANPPDGKVPRRVTPDLLTGARNITDPAERSLALQRIANGAIATSQLFLAHQTLEEAITSASQVTVPLVRDQRLIALVTSLDALADALLRTGRENLTATAPPQEAEAAGLDPLPKWPEAVVLIRLARLEWRRAVYLATIIANPTYRNEMLYRIAENEAIGSVAVANDYMTADFESLGNRPASAPPPPPATRPGAVPAPAPPPPPAPAPPPSARLDGRKDKAPEGDYGKLADEILVDAWDVARRIERLIWKNRAMVRLALAASDSRQYTRGVQLARTIENAESRAEALVLLAEAEARAAARRNSPELEAIATASYQAAAEAVASIPQDGLRGVIVGILIDSLIAVGRFDDARSCTVLEPDEGERFVELGAIAEQQGRRGAAEAARRWIATEAPEAYRPALFRRVTVGVLWSVEQNRSRDLPLYELPPQVR